MASKVKSTERIRLSDGQVMTLGEAIDAGLLDLKEVTYYSRTKEDSRGRALAMKQYVARERGGEGLGWEIGKTLYESRSGLAVSAAGGSKLEPNPDTSRLRADINAGKKLARDMTAYAQRVDKATGCGFTEAVRRMRADAPEVAREIGVSSAFVTVWAEGILSRSTR